MKVRDELRVMPRVGGDIVNLRVILVKVVVTVSAFPKLHGSSPLTGAIFLVLCWYWSLFLYRIVAAGVDDYTAEWCICLILR